MAYSDLYFSSSSRNKELAQPPPVLVAYEAAAVDTATLKDTFSN
jgi:hypothetical protein